MIKDICYGIDLFCGGGGSGSGIIEAFKAQSREYRGAFINHWDQAINIHSHNHPQHVHKITGVDAVNPKGQIVDDFDSHKVLPPDVPLTVLWGSPECTHHSIARGGKPMNEQSRATAYCLVRWIRHRRPEHVLVENVREFLDWGPLIQKRAKVLEEDPPLGRPRPISNLKGALLWVRKIKVDGKTKTEETTEVPFRQAKGEDARQYRKRLSEAGYEMSLTADPKRKGVRFRAWVREIRKMGYHLEWKILCSADYGDPTSRRRLFVNCVRIDTGKKVVWPSPTHCKPLSDGTVPFGLKPWRTAREIIDWSDLGQSIFTRKKPLSKKTLRRIAIGLERYGLKNFILPQNRGGQPVKSCDDPLGPVCTAGAEAVVQGHLEPFLVTQLGQSTAQSVDEPVPPVLTGPKHYVLDPALIKLKGTGTAGNVELPLDTVAAGGFHHALMQAFLIATDQTGGRPDGSYSPDAPVKTITTKANQAVVSVKLEPAVIQVAHGVDASNSAYEHTRVQSPDSTLGTVHAGGGSYGVMQGEIKPFIMSAGGPECPPLSVDNPVGTVLTRDHRAVVTAGFAPFIVPNFGERDGQSPRVHSVEAPLPTPTGHGAGALAQARISPFVVGTSCSRSDDSRVRGILEPLSIVCGDRGNQAVIRPWLYTYYSSGSAGSDIDNPTPTSTSHARMGICYPVVEVNGGFYILDIFFRMLGVRELARAQGFDDAYEFPGTKTDAVKAIGNSVSCGIARALVLSATTQNPNIVEYQS